MRPIHEDTDKQQNKWVNIKESLDESSTWAKENTAKKFRKQFCKKMKEQHQQRQRKPQSLNSKKTTNKPWTGAVVKEAKEEEVLHNKINEK